MVSAAMAVKDIFLGALEKTTPEERAAYLQATCQADSELFRRVEALLAAHDQPDSRLDQPRQPTETSLRSTTLASASEAVGTSIGPYQLLQVIGEGGMGVVYMAEQTEPVERRVALKIIKPGMDSRQVIARFEAERQALAMMDHQNIAKVFEAGTTDSGRPYFVMELVKGIPITKYCDVKRLSLKERLELMIPVCQAIQHAHQKGIIHRDIKPTNVLVAQYDGRPVPKVIDFGVAKATAQKLTEQTMFTELGQVVGTLEYMSPEQAELNQLDIDTRSDIYSLGVLLYELLTGSTPFDKQKLRSAAFHEMLRIIREDEPPKPSTKLSTIDTLASVAANRSVEPARLGNNVKGELDWIVMKALEKDRNRRYETASGLAADIARYLFDEPVQACPPSLSYRLRKFARRNATQIAKIATLMGVLALITGVIALQLWREAANRTRTAGQVGNELLAARTALEAADLDLADRHLAKAHGRLGEQRHALSFLSSSVDQLAAELVARRADKERFGTFLKQTRDAQQKMAYSRQRQGDVVAKEALSVFSILTDPNWVQKLDQSCLSIQQKNQVRTSAYETLITLADYGLRWRDQWLQAGEKPPLSPRQCLGFFQIAESIHEPTRAFWFCRYRAHASLKDAEAAKADQQRFQTTEATTAWDWYLPGHSAGWAGRYDEAIRSYQAALRIQPDHYDSLFFLADRLDVTKRTPEAIQLFTACIALRPQHYYAYQSRAACYEKLKQPLDAELDYTAGIAAVDNNYDRFFAHNYRREFYLRIGCPEKAQHDLDQQVMLAVDLVAEHRKLFGPDDARTLTILGWACRVYYLAARYQEVMPLQEELLERSKAVLGPTHTTTLNRMIQLGQVYWQLKKLDQATTVFQETLKLQKAKFGAGSAGVLKTKESLSRVLLDAGKYDDATILLREILQAQTKTLGASHDNSLATMKRLITALFAVHQDDEARSLLKEAIRLWRLKIDEIPGNATYRERLAELLVLEPEQAPQ